LRRGTSFSKPAQYGAGRHRRTCVYPSPPGKRNSVSAAADTSRKTKADRPPVVQENGHCHVTVCRYQVMLNFSEYHPFSGPCSATTSFGSHVAAAIRSCGCMCTLC